MIRVLTYSSLYPNNIQHRHGVFVENRLRQLAAGSNVEIHVVAPVPYFPFSSSIFGHYAEYAKVCNQEERYGIQIHHPRYPVIPKFGMSIAPVLMAVATVGTIKKLIQETGEFDLIDAHYFYPDGVAASLIAKWLSIPYIVTARGTDINLIPKYKIPRRWIKSAANGAAQLVTVCSALKDELERIGVDGGKIQVLRNGVDLEMFYPVDGWPVKKMLSIDGYMILSVGHLIKRKGHDIAIRTLVHLDDNVHLVIVGSGPEHDRLHALVKELSLSDRVHFVGEVRHKDLKQYYSSADVLVLASDREGWPNVLLEAMACGLPVVAADRWGMPEIVTAPEAGILVKERNPETFADAIKKILAQPPDRIQTRKYAERFSWNETTRRLYDLINQVRLNENIVSS